MMHNGTTRNYRIRGLTEHVTVITQVEGRPAEDSGEKPSEWMANGCFVAWITPRERRILRRGITRRGRDRQRLRDGDIFEARCGHPECSVHFIAEIDRAGMDKAEDLCVVAERAEDEAYHEQLVVDAGWDAEQR